MSGISSGGAMAVQFHVGMNHIIHTYIDKNINNHIDTYNICLLIYFSFHFYLLLIIIFIFNVFY